MSEKITSLPKITLAVFSQYVSTTIPGYRVKAADVEIGRNGVNTVLATATSNHVSREATSRLVQACIVAAIGILQRQAKATSEGGAAANRRWVAAGKPHFTLAASDFDIACPGTSHPRSRWNSKRLSLAAQGGPDIYSVDIVKGEGEIHFVPIG